jgi:CBS domain containing-hemolysin-like protein
MSIRVLLHAFVIAVLTAGLGLFGYVYRLYQERGRGTTRRARAHLEWFHEQLAPRLGLEHRRAVQTFGLLAQLTLVLVALAIGFATWTFAESPLRAVLETAFFVVLEILLVYQFLPHLLIARSSSEWLEPLVLALRGFAYAVLPLLLIYDFCVSLLHLAGEEEEEQEEVPGQAIEELVEEGQERGILEKEDVPLIASVLQFAGKTAREVMTPRPEIVGIPSTATIAELRKLMEEKHYSRIPVFGQSLDEIQGVVSVRDLLRVPESEAPLRQVSELMRPVLFVPETKPVVELTREMERERHPMAVVVDEYGVVTGLVTREDLAEEIIGELSDADQVRRAEVVRESERSFLVRGGIPLERLRQELDIAFEHPTSTTFAGLIHTWFGYIPKPGEAMERDGLRVEVLEATPRRVVRLRLTKLPPPSPEKGRRRSRKRQLAP